MPGVPVSTLAGGKSATSSANGAPSSVTGDPYNPTNVNPTGPTTTSTINNNINQDTYTQGNQAGSNYGQLEGTLSGGQGALDQYAQSAMSAAMPQLNAALQGQAESNVRRGVSTGDLGTSFQGDIYSAFQNNFSNAVGQQSMNMYNTNVGAESSLYNNDENRYEQELYGNRDNQTAQKNAKNQQTNALIGGLGDVIGGAAGAFL